jgi:galactose mutarotase-like enzyme
MFQVVHSAGELPTLELRDTATGSLAVLAPDRGGLLTRFRVGEADLLYMDEATLRDRSKNVRGGNPVLFPTPGKLDGDRWSQGGRSGALKQHGFARNEPWEVFETSTDRSARASLRLRSSARTLAHFPWEFSAEYSYALVGARLRIEQRFTNESAEPMPFAAGFHPYFAVPQADKATARIETGATRAFDNVTRREVAFGGVDLTAAEVDLHLLDHGSTASTLSWGGRTVRVAGSGEMTHWVVWTLSGRDFVCLEPWTAPGNAMNTGERLIWLEPAEERSLWVEFSLV